MEKGTETHELSNKDFIPLPSKSCQRPLSEWREGLGESPFSVLEPAPFVRPPEGQNTRRDINLEEEGAGGQRAEGRAHRLLTLRYSESWMIS